jgi:hypothetical protein
MLWPTVSRPIRLGVGHTFGAHNQIFAFLFVLGRPLWRGDRAAICSAICQWSESRRTHNHTLLSLLRLLSSLSVASYDSQGLRWKYSNPPPHGETRTDKSALHSPGTGRWDNLYSIISCPPVSGETCPQSSSPPKAVALWPVYTAVTWQWIYMSQQSQGLTNEQLTS